MCGGGECELFSVMCLASTVFTPILSASIALVRLARLASAVILCIEDMSWAGGGEKHRNIGGYYSGRLLGFFQYISCLVFFIIQKP